MEKICKSRPEITQICQISIKIQVPQNDFQKEIFLNFDVDIQMLDTCGSNEPFNTH